MGSNVDDIEQETALQWLIRLGCLKTCLSTGHEELDQLFHNTIPLRRILEVVGEDAVGKMQFMMTVASTLLLSAYKKNYRIIVLDYNGTFRINRLLEIIKARSKCNISADMETELLERITINPAIYNASQLENSLIQLNNEFQLRKNVIPLLLVNKIGAILHGTTTEFTEDRYSRTLALDRILSLMHRFCSNCGATIIVTNHFVHWRGTPCSSLGSTWINGIQTKLILWRDTDSIFYATVERDKKKSDRSVKYTISKAGFSQNTNNLNFF